MAGPITWRNVGATVSGNGAASLMEGARESMNDGLGSLNKILDDRRKLSESNFETQQTNLAADFQDRIQQAQSLDELNALRNDPGLQQLREQLTGTYRNQVRGSLDSRETGLMDRLNSRQTHQDTQWTRDNQEALAGVERMVIDGNLEGALEQATSMGAPNARKLVTDLYNSHTNVTTEQRAQDQNARSWNDDARASNRDSREQGRFENENRLADRQWNTMLEGDALDDATANFYLRLGEQNTDMTATELRNRFTRELVGEGYTLQQAQNAAANLDNARVSRLAMAGEDSAALEAQQQQLVSSMNMTNNPVYLAGGFSQDPLADANAALSEFKDENGLLFGESDPEERGAYVSDAQTALGPGIPLFGKQRRIPMDVLQGALQAVPGSYWLPDAGNSVKDAITKYVSENKGVLQYIDDYSEFEEASIDLQSTVSGEVRPQNGLTRLSLMELTGGN